MTTLRSYLCGFLALILVLTGQSVAMARGMPLAAGLIEICSGGRAIMIMVDENGEPTGGAHICPEFTLNITDPVPAQSGPSRPQSFAPVAEVLEANVEDTQHRQQSGYARAPPSFS